MSQISPPFRIALVAIALLGAVWFVALRPKADAGTDAPLPAAPGVTGLSTATGKAEAATGAAEASAERAEAAAAAAEGGATVEKSTVVVTGPSGASAVAKSATAKPAKAAEPAASANPAAPLLTALDRGRVVVLLFRNRSSDSASVATMVRAIGERRKVVARVVSIKDVGRYQTFTAGTPIAQAPTTMVIGPRRNAKVIVGFTSRGEIAQAVADVRRAGAASS